jgi:site-specific recombinase XerD
MRCRIKVVHRIGTRKNSRGEYSVRIRVTLNRQTIYLSTGHHVREADWAGKPNEWIKLSTPDALRFNKLISKRIAEIREWELRQEDFGNTVSLGALKTFFERRGEKNLFLTYAEEYVSKIRGKSDNTLKLYRTFLRHFANFEPTVSFNHINPDFIVRFLKWLVAQGMAGISAHKYFKPFRLICREAVKDGYLEKDPFFGVALSKVVKPAKAKKRIYLEREEIALIKSAPLPGHLQKVRTWFLFSFYAGFYYSDLRTLRWSSIKASKHGPYIETNRFKNDQAYCSPIYAFENALAILDLQRGQHPELVFPDTISEQKYNGKLKEMSNLIGLGKPIMNKTARHSYVQFLKSQGLPTSIVQTMVGHTREATTKEYFQLSITDVSEYLEKAGISSNLSL